MPRHSLQVAVTRCAYDLLARAAASPDPPDQPVHITVSDGKFEVRIEVRKRTFPPFEPRAFQLGILDALADKALQVEELVKLVRDHPKLYPDPGRIKGSQRRGLVEHDTRGCYFRPAAPSGVRSLCHCAYRRRYGSDAAPAGGGPGGVRFLPAAHPLAPRPFAPARRGLNCCRTDCPTPGFAAPIHATLP